jgi:hypothetical protein
MSQSEQTPTKELQFSFEESVTPLASQELTTSLLTDEESVEGKVISLAATAKKDAELTAGWDEHTSDEEEFDPDAENKSPEKEDDEEDESDSEDAPDLFHEKCVAKGRSLMDQLMLEGWKCSTKKKEASAALVGVLEDYFSCN